MNEPLIKSLEELRQVNTTGGRYYERNGNIYYSVTRILSETSDKTFLDKWQARVGIEEAVRIRETSSQEGTDMHSSLTEWLLGQPISSSKTLTQLRIKPIQSFLKKEIKILMGCDSMLYSDNLRIAGTFDLLYVDFNSNLVLCDFKTASREKKTEWLENYFCQIALYSIMLEERYPKLIINKGLLLFSYSDLTIDPIYFHPNKFYNSAKKRVNLFFDQLNNNKSELMFQ